VSWRTDAGRGVWQGRRFSSACAVDVRDKRLRLWAREGGAYTSALGLVSWAHLPREGSRDGTALRGLVPWTRRLAGTAFASRIARRRTRCDPGGREHLPRRPYVAEPTRRVRRLTRVGSHVAAGELATPVSRPRHTLRLESAAAVRRGRYFRLVAFLLDFAGRLAGFGAAFLTAGFLAAGALAADVFADGFFASFFASLLAGFLAGFFVARLVDSLTVVFGLALTAFCVTNSPVAAERPRLAVALAFGFALGLAFGAMAFLLLCSRRRHRLGEPLSLSDRHLIGAMLNRAADGVAVGPSYRLATSATAIRSSDVRRSSTSRTGRRSKSAVVSRAISGAKASLAQPERRCSMSRSAPKRRTNRS
jgi:hypothetical protein